jgi:nicotinamide-nucleotide amidase
VPAELFEKHGAVSEEVARAMAEGALKQSGADHAVSVTGIAGPTGGTPEKPVGTVWIGLASKNAETWALKRFYPGARDRFKLLTSQAALDILRRRLCGLKLRV